VLKKGNGAAFNTYQMEIFVSVGGATLKFFDPKAS